MNGAGLIEALLAGTLDDLEGGRLHVSTRSVVIAPSLARGEAELVRALDLGRHFALVSDPTTHAVLGERVERALGSLGRVDPIRLPEVPHADLMTVAWLEPHIKMADAIIAVGSGTINDLCKLAAFRQGKPYVVFATAPSMNGYTSTNASITAHGHKKSFAAQAPLGVFIDLGVFAAAPARMIRAGLGDSLCRPTAQADWLLAHLLLERPYREVPYRLLAADEVTLITEPEALLAGDLDAMAALARTLILSGFGMTICGGSEPASQGEHLISHYVDMLGDPAWPEAFHGEQIGVTTLTMARLQHAMLDGPVPELAPDGPDEAALIAHYGPELGRSCWKEFAKKRLDVARAERLNERLASGWDEIRERIAAITLPEERLRTVLARAGAPRTPEELGWPRAFYRGAVQHAREIRDRYTFLDLAADSGFFARGFEP